MMRRGDMKAYSFNRRPTQSIQQEAAAVSRVGSSADDLDLNDSKPRRRDMKAAAKLAIKLASVRPANPVKPMILRRVDTPILPNVKLWSLHDDY